eukprot:364617-Chlamydomonas_euryale.AAC.1
MIYIKAFDKKAESTVHSANPKSPCPDQPRATVCQLAADTFPRRPSACCVPALRTGPPSRTACASGRLALARRSFRSRCPFQRPRWAGWRSTSALLPRPRSRLAPRVLLGGG